MVSVLDSGSRGLGSSAGWGHCVVFLGKTLHFHGASLHPCQEYKRVPVNCWGNVTKCWGVITCDGLASHPESVGEAILLVSFMLQKPG